MKTPVTPVNARVSASASSISAIATSQPRSDQNLPLSASRTTARTSLARGQQGARDGAADLARDTGDCKHENFPFRRSRGRRTSRARRRRIDPRRARRRRAAVA